MEIKVDIPIDDPRARAWVEALSAPKVITHEGRVYRVIEVDWDKAMTTAYFVLQVAEAAE